MMHFAACSNPNDFKCGSGECVEYASLCDGVSNCADSSDEKLCCKYVQMTNQSIKPSK